jgi:hypothetical protein
MSLSAKLRRAPLRLATGAYILNTGLTKLNADDETAKSLHGMASGTYPVLGKLEPKVFAPAHGRSLGDRGPSDDACTLIGRSVKSPALALFPRAIWQATAETKSVKDQLSQVALGGSGGSR